jgi:hypothetical protein
MKPSVEKQHGKTRTHREAEVEGVGSPISNEAYNVIAALHAKLEGLEAYRKYSKDAPEPLWRELTQGDVECVGKLVDTLEQLVKRGGLRMRKPGETGH